MNKETFLILTVVYYFISISILIGSCFLLNAREKKKYKKEIEILERDKNLIISASILSELNKVETLVKNNDLKVKYDAWKKRFNDIKEKDLINITEQINEVENHFFDKNYTELKKIILRCEIDLNKLKTKSDFLLDEIKEITTSEERNRLQVTKLKADFREILSNYKSHESAYELIKEPLELQFENTEKLFATFEDLMEKNNYSEVTKIVKSIDSIISNLKHIVDETKTIISLANNLIPKKIHEVSLEEGKLIKDHFNLDYLNIEYNKEEAEKKITEILDKLQLLNIEDSLFELKTMYDYFDSLLSDFDKERLASKIFEELLRTIIIKTSKLEQINNELIKKLDEIIYSYDLQEGEIDIVYQIKDELNTIRDKYDKNVETYRARVSPFSKLSKEMENLKYDLLKTEEKLNTALRTLGSLKDDELRAREQLCEIKEILIKTKENIKSYKLPVTPKNFYIELSEAMDAINIMNEELEKKPISIKMLNLRVDNARDLVLKVHNTVNETIRTAEMAEIVIVYGNRYRLINKEVDFNLIKAENLFFKGNFKNSLENAINAVNIVEPGIHKRLLEEYKI